MAKDGNNDAGRMVGGKPPAGISGHLEVEALRSPKGLAVSVKGGGEPKFLHTLQLVATVTYDDQSTEDVTHLANWSSSDTKKVTVANTGPHKGLCSKVAMGKATITATLPES